jgi:hypothetical protein
MTQLKASVWNVFKASRQRGEGRFAAFGKALTEHRRQCCARGEHYVEFTLDEEPRLEDIRYYRKNGFSLCEIFVLRNYAASVSSLAELVEVLMDCGSHKLAAKVRRLA